MAEVTSRNVSSDSHDIKHMAFGKTEVLQDTQGSHKQTLRYGLMDRLGRACWMQPAVRRLWICYSLRRFPIHLLLNRHRRQTHAYSVHIKTISRIAAAVTKVWWECVWWSGSELWRTQKDELKEEKRKEEEGNAIGAITSAAETRSTSVWDIWGAERNREAAD